MEIVEFKEVNVRYAEHQLEYLTLPAHRTDEGIVTCCWKCSWKERLRVLFTGKFFIQLMTFNQPLTPLRPSVTNPLHDESERIEA